MNNMLFDEWEEITVDQFNIDDNYEYKIMEITKCDNKLKKTYNTIKMLTDAGMKQINIHFVLHDKSYKKAFNIIDDIASDDRLKGLKSIVFLKYKPKGNGIGKFNQVNIEQYKKLIKYAQDKNVNIGFDSCSAHAYMKTIQGKPNYKQLVQYVEPCESSCFSSYINYKGEFFACSFCEGEGMWRQGLDVLNCNNFVEDIWNNNKTNDFRKMLLKNERRCPMFLLD